LSSGQIAATRFDITPYAAALGLECRVFPGSVNPVTPPATLRIPDSWLPAIAYRPWPTGRARDARNQPVWIQSPTGTVLCPTEECGGSGPFPFWNRPGTSRFRRTPLRCRTTSDTEPRTWLGRFGFEDPSGQELIDTGYGWCASMSHLNAVKGTVGWVVEAPWLRLPGQGHSFPSDQVPAALRPPQSGSERTEPPDCDWTINFRAVQGFGIVGCDPVYTQVSNVILLE